MIDHFKWLATRVKQFSHFEVQTSENCIFFCAYACFIININKIKINVIFYKLCKLILPIFFHYTHRQLLFINNFNKNYYCLESQQLIVKLLKMDRLGVTYFYFINYLKCQLSVILSSFNRWCIILHISEYQVHNMSNFISLF